MNINRHNYEEFFLLYLDNELSSEERSRVELFVQENPDLGEELKVLLQSKVSPDNTIVFANKELLMKEAVGISINLQNYEEWLLLYTDNELSPAQRETVEKFATQNPF